VDVRRLTGKSTAAPKRLINEFLPRHMQVGIWAAREARRRGRFRETCYLGVDPAARDPCS
jgi:hypothetical protein